MYIYLVKFIIKFLKLLEQFFERSCCYASKIEKVEEKVEEKNVWFIDITFVTFSSSKEAAKAFKKGFDLKYTLKTI